MGLSVIPGFPHLQFSQTSNLRCFDRPTLGQVKYRLFFTFKQVFDMLRAAIRLEGWI